MRVKCLAQEHNTMSPARPRTRTTRSGVERTNHEATAHNPTLETSFESVEFLFTLYFNDTTGMCMLELSVLKFEGGDICMVFIYMY